MTKPFFPALAILLTGALQATAVAAPPRAVAPPPESAAWLERAVTAYRTHNIPRVTADVSPTWLEQQYAAQEPQSLNAAAVAYYGALTQVSPQPWIGRLLAAARQRGGVPLEQDAREVLPEALARVAEQRQSPEAVAALMNLTLDGHYQENLNQVRFSLFLRQPERFTAVLSAQPFPVLTKQARKRQFDSFTGNLVYTLHADPDLRRRFAQRHAALKAKPTTPEWFLRRYLTLVLDAAQAKAVASVPTASRCFSKQNTSKYENSAEQSNFGVVVKSRIRLGYR